MIIITSINIYKYIVYECVCSDSVSTYVDIAPVSYCQHLIGYNCRSQSRFQHVLITFCSLPTSMKSWYILSVSCCLT